MEENGKTNWGKPTGGITPWNSPWGENIKMKSQTKQQATGALWTLVGALLIALIIWGATRVEDENHWDSEAVQSQQTFNDYVKQNDTTLMDLRETRLRTEQRNISKELRKLERREGSLTESEKAYKELLEEQLTKVTKQQDVLILTNPD